MFDFILRNIFILLPLAIFIAIRIMEARRKYQDRNQNQGEEKPRKIFDFFGDEDEELSIPLPGESYRREITPPQPKPQKQPVRRPVVKETLLSQQIKEAEISTREVSKKVSQGTTQVQSGTEKDFTERLSFLSPLQRAVAMAEILGQPKGL